MRWIRTLRFRFALWTAALIVAILAAFGGFVYFNLGLSLRSAVDYSLSLSAAQTATSLNISNGQIAQPEPITPDESGSQVFGEHGLTIIVLDANGTVLQAAGTYRAWPVSIDTLRSQSEYRTISIQSEVDMVRVYILPVKDNNQIVGWVEAMQSLGDVQDSLQRLLVILLIGGGALSLLAGFVGYFLATRALAPIDNITQAAGRISSEDLSARLQLPDTGDEVSRLAATFNDMLARLESGFKRERQFTADASHELRTPLAAMQSILSVVRQRNRSSAEYRQALDDLADETNRMRGLVEDLLSLARGETDASLEHEPIDLTSLLADVADSIRPLAKTKGLVLDVNVQEGLQIRGNLDALIRLFINLLDNAIKYTERGTVTLFAFREQNTIRVDVSDTGVGIPPKDLAHIFERFYRVEAARSSPGAGLGLAIAHQIALSHGGEIKVSSMPGTGTTFSLILPS